MTYPMMDTIHRIAFHQLAAGTDLLHDLAITKIGPWQQHAALFVKLLIRTRK